MSKILVVDDDTMTLDACARGLRLAGHTVYTANHPKVAIDMIKAHRPEIVVSDLQMPEMEGDELCRAAKKIAPEIGFILQSGHASVTKKAIDCGASYGFMKPVPPRVLRDAIAELIAHRRKA